MVDTTKKEKPHYAGHRERLRERFLKGGADALQDYELLELILFMAIPRRDVKPLAKTLIKSFGSLPALFRADTKTLLSYPGVTENVATAILSVGSAALYLVKADVMNRPILSSWARVMEYCYAAMAHEKREQFRLLFLNKKNELIADEVQQTGTIDHTPVYPREIIKRALEHGASALILLHNHPSGDPTPSEDDLKMTKEIIDAGRTFSITVHDHVIIGRKGLFSMRNKGLI